MHNNKNDVKKCLPVSDSTIARIEQQYKLNTVRAPRKSTVDDTVISTFQPKLIDTLNDYNHKYIMNILYATTKGGSVTQERLLKFINQVIIKHTDGAPAALFLDAASINRSDATRELCNKNNITIVPIPPNTTAWLQPCDVGPAKNKVRKAMKHALNTDECPSILMSCGELHKAIH